MNISQFIAKRTGLMILTNDSAFSESLTRPENKIPKTYLVTTDRAITEAAITKFRTGMSFEKENTRSQPAIVDLLSETSCRLTIHEGLHQQIKRMLLRFGIRVTNLHRESIGPYELGELQPGQCFTKRPQSSITSPPGHSPQATP